MGTLRSEHSATQADSAGGPVEAVRILVVTAEPTLRQLVPACLRFAGYAPELARDSDEALASAERMRPDLFVIETGYRDKKSAALARELRVRYVADAPILFLADAHEAAAATMALTVGGDRFLAKPFSLDDLTAEVRGLLRRAAVPRSSPGAVLRFADLEFDEDTLDVRRKGRVLRLAPRERRILRFLLVNAGRPVTRTEIVEHVWPYNHGGHRRVLDVHVCSLRREINKGGRPLIQTLHGVGYYLQDPSATTK